MSLDWNLGQINDWESSCYIRVGSEHKAYDRINVKQSRLWFAEKDSAVKKCMNPITETLINLTMSLCLGEITEDNISEWQFRLWLTEKLDGEPLIVSRWDNEGKWVDDKITVSDLRGHIGLSTNVGDMTRKEWLKRVFKRGYEQRIDFKNRWRE